MLREMYIEQLTALVKRRLRANRNWVRLRRVQREGFGAAWSRWRLWSRILATKPVVTRLCAEGEPVEVHLLCCEGDYLTALWALKTFYNFSGEAFPLAIHFQGPMTRRIERNVSDHFPRARLISQTEADEWVEAELRAAGLKRLISARRRSPFMLKLTDLQMLCRARRTLMIDSDILFFSRPSSVLDAAESCAPQSMFMRDPADNYNISRERAREVLRIDLAPRVNTGLVIVDRNIIDFNRCDYFLSDEEIARPTGFIEQTLYALVASERGQVGYLPASYLVSLAPRVCIESLVARHYAGPTRALLTSEGMPRLLQTGWLEKSSGKCGK